jgi:large subunit ribosomal protein L25
LDAKNITLEYHKGHIFTTLIDIDIDGKKELVLARDVQTHVVKDNILHVDLLRVSAKTKIAVMVPVTFTNEDDCPAMKAGGILNTVRHEVELMCKATEIPESLEVSLAGKEFGDSVNVSDAIMQDGVKPVIDDRDFTIATLVEPKKVEEETTENEGAPEASEVPSDNGGDNAEEDSK